MWQRGKAQSLYQAFSEATPGEWAILENLRPDKDGFSIFTTMGFSQDRTFSNLGFSHQHIPKEIVSNEASFTCCTKNVGLLFWNSESVLSVPLVLCSMQPKLGPHQNSGFTYIPYAFPLSSCSPSPSLLPHLRICNSSPMEPTSSNSSPLEVIISSHCIVPVHLSWIKQILLYIIGINLHFLSLYYVKTGKAMSYLFSYYTNCLKLNIQEMLN